MKKLLILVGFLWVVPSAHSLLFTVGFEGYVQYVFNDWDIPLWGAQTTIPINTKIAGSYTYDLSVQGTIIDGKYDKGVNYSNVLLNYRVNIGDVCYSPEYFDQSYTNHITYLTDTWLDFDEEYKVFARGGYDGFPNQDLELFLRFGGNDGAIKNTSLGNPLPNPSDFEQSYLYIKGVPQPQPNFYILSKITNMYEIPQPIPEPATFVLLGLGLIPLLRRKAI